MAGVEHSFFYIWEDENVSRTDTHFLLVNMDCLLSLLSNTLFETQERQRFNYITFVSMQTRCVLFFFLLSGYGNRFFFTCCENPYMKREGSSCLCVPVVSWDIYVEKTSTPDCIFKEERLLFMWCHVIMSIKGFLWTAFILVNSRHQLTST